jgi:hypothetical protein
MNGDPHSTIEGDLCAMTAHEYQDRNFGDRSATPAG